MLQLPALLVPARPSLLRPLVFPLAPEATCRGESDDSIFGAVVDSLNKIVMSRTDRSDTFLAPNIPLWARFDEKPWVSPRFSIFLSRMLSEGAGEGEGEGDTVGRVSPARGLFSWSIARVSRPTLIGHVWESRFPFSSPLPSLLPAWVHSPGKSTRGRKERCLGS